MIGLSLVKLSVLLFYAKLFGSVRIYRIAFWIVGSIIIGWCVAMEFLANFPVVPIQKAWLLAITGHCLDSNRVNLGSTISNVVIDVIVLILPIPMLWKMNIQRQRKVELVGVFAAGYW